MFVFTRWLIGLTIGTLLMAAISPAFVRSYHSRVHDEVLGTQVYPEGTRYRWRSEGYATTRIGPHGMAGRLSVDATEVLPELTKPKIDSEASGETMTRQRQRIALWGDSQAEGVAVDDLEKLWAKLQRKLSCEVLPMAQSGQDARDWVNRFQTVEDALRIDEHFILLCELEDVSVLSIAGRIRGVDFQSPSLETAAESRRHVKNASQKVQNDAPESNQAGAWIDFVPDMVIHAGRGFLIDPATGMKRSWRFGIGPIARDFVAPRIADRPDAEPIDWPEIASRLVASTRKPITVIYAPRVPHVMNGRVYRDDPSADEFQALAWQLSRAGCRVIDCRDAFRQSVDAGVFPHGFHNGVIGNGHLNGHGYEIIARQVAAGRP